MRLTNCLNALLHEPLLGFALSGGLIFLLYMTFGDDARQRIVISEDAVQAMVEERRLVLNREVDASDRDRLIRSLVDNEILLNEAIARGLYLSDAKVRKRLVQKMNFLLAEEPPEPTPAQLQALFDAMPDDYVTPRTTSFEHVFFKTDSAAAQAVLPGLRDGSYTSGDVGEIFWLGSDMQRYSSKQLLILLGFEFDRALKHLPVDEWHGPVRSGRGWHLVRVTARHEPQVLADDELQRKLVQDWKAQWREHRREQAFAMLRDRYEVVYPQSMTDG
jgi:hypothetical protein